MNLAQHGLIAAIVLPLLTAALLLLISEKRRRLKGWLNLAATFAGAVLAFGLVQQADTANGVYLAGNWPAPFGIVLVLDRLSAMMVLLTAVLGCATLLFALARWDRAGAHFHALFQVQLLGLNGAFLTGDLFNLFVFFEVMLAASYGLLLHGSGRARVLAGMHYLAINLVASSLFLVGAALVYGVTGTLNMADIAVKVSQVTPHDIGLLHAGVAILAIAFLTKAGMWPLNAWLVPAYGAASAPVAALFSLMTKVGVYAVLRLWALAFPDGFGQAWLVGGGLATLTCAVLGLLAARRLERLAALNILVSAGTLLAAIGLGGERLLGAALFYLVGSTLAVAALFLIAELIERARAANDVPLDDEDCPLPAPLETLHPPQDVNLDDEQRALVGRVIPWNTAFLGLAFILCALMVIGMPPLAGFIGKINLIAAILEAQPPGATGWALVLLLVLAGIAALMALSRVGMLRLWSPAQPHRPALRPLECCAVVALLSLCVVLTLRAEPLLQYTRASAQALLDPGQYIHPVLAAAATEREAP
ncbi:MULTISPECIES: monovalent cation/H+ antiporter subunit D [unclassified Pseudomonas]|uniref:monovalent cation/H+ antiporter subunit D n=1 Tax=unclassified Pseudomonas TaxID=196821 RepID=UPI000BCD8A45|nr:MULTISPECIES: monovalent cation/H+ antiporter subunit D [unclassified Pseudomonas]PVZ13484.1 multicomponent K+:H+ antiporter subunit D [Pseudomonas sp. URIL14HWK12:I12]PVZ23790.1 multicomponent K+:H+ antiporter subunit D [Pseudomonas sp. URIL14HWK12:I10]PVZ33571.1 multicomponent K+:H+ antiporter subunit D [Pseudomonas sp. URIL14HWK12:I11]SNZ12055.1 multisubunit potassium/proton antiporter, PhaD subunit (TC 2.A.63.1.1) [Pseudomonas sp. URIL14HWK12:I9]